MAKCESSVERPGERSPFTKCRFLRHFLWANGMRQPPCHQQNAALKGGAERDKGISREE